ncbi:MAG TPA: hypothetical protein VH724_12550 [Candidatus Angelobacter sp.]|nr:hypothetical protein [Candidatus Angelobacter sp.]
MKPLRLKFATIGLASALGILCGCPQKKPVLVAPQQPPTVAAQPTPTPEPEAPQPAEQTKDAPPAPTPAEQPTKTAAEKTKQKTNRHATARKPSPAVSATSDKPASEVTHNTTPKIVISPEPKPQSPPTEGAQIAPGPTPASAANDQASTDQLLQNAESNLNGIKRLLNQAEEAMRAQIKVFIAQSHKATTENDPARAHTLAVKARLLSEELVKQK